LTINKKVALLTISIIYGGFILGGFPNIIFLTGLTFLILGISLFFSRIFCGYVCPLGATQELISMVRFKPVLDYNMEIKNNRFLPYVRWLFFGGFFILILILGFEITIFMNPMNGFLFLWYPTNLFFIIPVTLLIGTMIMSFFSYRPFCRYVCPFGAIASLVARISPLRIRRTEACIDCGLCEKICPTQVGFQNSKKGECYLCNRCIDFCSNYMFVDIRKLSQINQYLTVFSLNRDILTEEKFFDNIIKSIIRLFVPKRRFRNFDDFINALKGKRNFYENSIQNIVERIKKLFPDEVKTIDEAKYKQWIKRNEPSWGKRKEAHQLDKIVYGLTNRA
jgi:polyferredoxin